MLKTLTKIDKPIFIVAKYFCCEERFVLNKCLISSTKQKQTNKKKTLITG